MSPLAPGVLAKLTGKIANLNPFNQLSDSICLTSTNTRPQWEEVPEAASALVRELEQLYWDGIRRELIEVIRTLKAWQHADLRDVELNEEKDGVEICGFDTFLDQVSESSREFAVDYATQRARAMQRTARGEFVPYEMTLQSLARKLYANDQSRALKEEILKAANNTALGREDKVKMRARMLLQSAAWLDMDKFIEHRPPLDELGFWKRPAPPQLALQGFDQNLQPLLRPVRCVLCLLAIRGTMFRCTVPDCTDKGGEGFICQACQHEGRHPDNHLVKQHKRCVLDHQESLISPSMSRQLCQCTTVARFDDDGFPRALFPVLKTDHHRATTKGGVSCCLLELPSAIAEAKYQGIAVLKTDEKTSLRDQRRWREEAARKAEEKTKRVEKRHYRWDYGATDYQTATSETISEQQADQDIPFFIRNITDRYPFGNVHMALRVGPLVVENGVEHTQGGALITSRDPPQWQLSHQGTDRDIEKCLSVSGGEERRLYKAPHRGAPRKPKRYKTALKQVVGGLFSGFCRRELEDQVIGQVVEASTADLDNPEDHPREREAAWEAAVSPTLENLRLLMHSRVRLMLSSIARKLLDDTVDLKWDRRHNNCQNFCDNMIDYSVYGAFLAPSPLEHDDPPPYLMSFVCRPGSYTRERAGRARTKFDVPSGLCEEYLLKFRYGLHVDSDIVDSLLEYWYDWGAFGGPLYPYQDLFPWDCTEAYGRSNLVCGAGENHNIAKHVWSFPFDSWSIIELHLTRSRLMYDQGAQTQSEWMKNRLTVLSAENTLLEGAKAMANSASFQASTAWMAEHEDARMDRYKLGGIHRAQPFSHHYEEGKYHEYFIADWAHLCRDDQIAEYEAIREMRRQLADMPEDSGSGSAGLTGGRGGDDSMMGLGLILAGSCAAVALFGSYFTDGWDGSYESTETMSPGDQAMEGTVDPDYSADTSGGGGDYSCGGDGGSGGGCGG
ncbi:hypothetical protein B0T26DRAFT_228208 [Lasiosphaeria miniovina]|uniref:Uncharacterized protein n=1 Tax=Lasiosphaeria miniovina TaxID=1954250 RepID=A0AA40E4X0_9PEZI|nr:uncharacterized protein B0T26DRAFT_228208 [Lasiosphaeria miniovina]KAK0722628.1 hypothetical protein B0T26DRAFT_228208 [Lasiosphaeria miniovina]